MTDFTIQNTELADLVFICQLFDDSVRYQKQNGYPDWENYDRQALVKDIKAGNQYKVIADEQIAIVFSVCYSDATIWREREAGDALYLHRIVVNPVFKGQRLFGTIVDWARRHCQAKGLRFVRMDTWANNPTIVGYYKTFGFADAGSFTTPDTEDLPVHNRNLALALLEMKVVPALR